MNEQPMPSGWYPDQINPTLVRYWDGQQWTAHTAPAQPPTAQHPASQGSAWRERWRSFRLRTKVLLVVGALVVFGALLPDEDQEPTASDSQQSTQATEQSATSDDADQVEAEDEVSAEDAADEAVEEPEPIEVPSLRAQSIDQAKALLRRAGLKTKIVRQPSWQPVGEVLKQSTQAGAALTVGTVVTLVVAAAMPKVPGVFGQGAVAAQNALRQAGFKVRVVTKDVSSGADNVVIGQTPAGAQSAAPGSVVQLVVSNFVAPPPPPPVPLVSNCTTGYKPCLAPASDYDCAGGSGNGPMYAYGPIYVTGSDPYDLDSEGDGIACE